MSATTCHVCGAHFPVGHDCVPYLQARIKELEECLKEARDQLGVFNQLETWASTNVILKRIDKALR